MGFSIDYGSFGLFGGLVLAFLVGVGLIVTFTLLSAAKRSRDQVVEEEGDDPDLIA